MADGVDPFDHPIGPNDAELHIVIRSFSDRTLDCVPPPIAIVRVDAFDAILPSRSLRWIDAVNTVQLTRDMHRAAIRHAPRPAAGMGQLLRLGKVCLPAFQFL